MGIAFNDSGLITRGMGTDHKVITRGMSQRFEFGGIRPRIKKEYYLDIFASVIKKSYKEINLFVPIKINLQRNIKIYSSIYKSFEKDIKLFGRINHGKLFKILDAI